jgi:hypothetical protein
VQIDYFTAEKINLMSPKNCITHLVSTAARYAVSMAAMMLRHGAVAVVAGFHQNLCGCRAGP